MTPLYADFNAMTEDGHISLMTIGSQEEVRRAGVGPGDWAWLSDGEVLVGARLQTDAKYGLVGVPEWETLVHFDDEEAEDRGGILEELTWLLEQGPESDGHDARIFRLLTQLERIDPTAFIDAGFGGRLSGRRGAALRRMGYPGLAALEVDNPSGDRVGPAPR